MVDNLFICPLRFFLATQSKAHTIVVNNIPPSQNKFIFGVVKFFLPYGVRHFSYDCKIFYKKSKLCPRPIRSLPAWKTHINPAVARSFGADIHSMIFIKIDYSPFQCSLECLLKMTAYNTNTQTKIPLAGQ